MDKKSVVITLILLVSVLLLRTSYAFVIKEDNINNGVNAYSFNILFSNNNNILENESRIYIESNYLLNYNVLINGNYDNEDNIDIYINDVFYKNVKVNELNNYNDNKLLFNKEINGIEIIKLILNGSNKYKISVEK